MAGPKTYFEQIPVKTVKAIAKEFPDQREAGSDRKETETGDAARLPRERWREMAEKIQQERDPETMIDLVQQLIETLDREELSKRPARAPVAGKNPGGG